VKKILIIQTAFLGDVILATPVVSELKRIFPSASIDFLLKEGNQSLLHNNPHLNEVIVFNKKKGKYRAIFKLIKQFRNTKYDLVINLHRFGSSGIIAGLSGGKSIIGFKKNPYSFLYSQKFKHEIGNGTHEVERNLSVIHHLGAVSLKRPELFPSEINFAAVKKYINQDYVCIAPASVWFTKQTPINKWIELINSLKNSTTIYLLGGPSDFQLSEEIASQSKNNNVQNLAGKLNLLESAALMKTATNNFVNDSGPLHIASAMNANVTAFFCSTTPLFGFGPLSENSKIIEVINLDCRPCGLHGHKECPKGHFNCGNQLKL
jgi:lipopolysaccharide heptosyltransferase II